MKGTLPKEVFFAIAAVAFAAAAWFTVDRALFLSGAAQADAEVLEVVAEDADCGKGRHQCTKFYIRVAWSGGGEDFEDGIKVGDARGYGAPVPSDLGYAAGDTVALLYDPVDPSEHYLADDTLRIWRTPLFCLGIAAFFGLVGAFGRKKVI